MGSVLDNFRAKYPEYNDLADDQVIGALGRKYPEYRRDPDFNAAWLRVGASPSLGPVMPTPAAPVEESAATKAWEGSTSPRPSPQSGEGEAAYARANREFQAHLGLAGDNPEWRSKAEGIYKQRLGELGIGYVEDIGPVDAFGKVIGPAVQRGTKALRAAVGDVAEGLAGTSGPGFLPLPNISSFANDPDAPLPIERKIDALEPGAARVAGKAGLALAGAPVPMGLAVLGGEVGLPQSAANLAAMGFDAEGKVDPVGALAAVGLPVTDKLGRDFVREAFFRKELFKFSPEGLKDLFARVARGEGSAAEQNLAKTLEEQVQGVEAKGAPAEVKATGVKTSAQQKAAEVAGGLLADNVYMLGLQLPGIMASEHPKAALENAVAGQLGWMFMGLPELMGKRAKYEGVRVEVGPEVAGATANAAGPAQRAELPAAAEVQTSGPGASGQNLSRPAESRPGETRQPWEMTREEYAAVSPYPATQLSRAREHGRLVAAAVAAGQPVPQPVLDEYQEMLAGTQAPNDLAGAPLANLPPEAGGSVPTAQGAPAIDTGTGMATPPSEAIPPEEMPRPFDVLDAIAELGGIAGPKQSKFANKGEYDGYDEAFGTGPAKGLRRTKSGGLRPDELRDTLAANYGFKFDSVSQMYEAVQRASEGRSRARRGERFAEEGTPAVRSEASPEMTKRQQLIPQVKRAIATAKKEWGPGRGAFDTDLEASHEVGPLFEHFSLPEGVRMRTHWFRSKWGSWYSEVDYVDSRDNLHEWKLSVRDHQASRGDLGIPDISYEIGTKNWTPEEVDRALTRIEEGLRERVERVENPPAPDRAAAARREMERYRAQIADLGRKLAAREAQGRADKAANIRKQINEIQQSHGYRNALEESRGTRIVPGAPGIKPKLDNLGSADKPGSTALQSATESSLTPGSEAEARGGVKSFGEGSRGGRTKSVKTPGVSTAAAKASGYAALPAGKASKTVPMVLGGMAHVRPIEMPEIVRMAKELMGSAPKLKRFPRARGMFYATGGGAIKLHPDIFKDSVDAAKTLAHEVGHLDDYLPDRTMARGNLLGRLFTLKKWLKEQLGPGGVRNSDLRKELIALAQYWKPYPADPPESYIKYRESAAELYADALSILMNDPALLESRAPKFWKAFWEQIDRKPAVKRALFDLQDLLNTGKVAVLDRRQADVEAMFAKGEEVIRRKAAERELRRKSWKGHWLELKQQLADVYEPIVDRARKAEAAGAKWAPAQDPRNILESGLMVDNTNGRFVRRLWEGVVKPVEDAGISLVDLGRYLKLRREQTQRAEIANPGGETPETARQGLLKMRLDLGMERMTRLEAAVKKFHDLVFEVVTEAVAVGSYNKETYDTTIVPNRDVYAAFANLDYLEDYVPAAIRKQVGMLGEIANPFTATVLKTITLNNLNSLQRSKNATRDLLRKYFPAEIEAAQGRMLPGGMRAAPPSKPGWGTLEMLEDGKRAYYYVDPLIAHAFERMSPQGLHRVLRVLDVVFRKGFYRAWITYGPSFLMFNPGRDFARSWQNMAQTPAGRPGALALAMAYARTFQSALSQVRGMPDALAKEMQANYAIGAPSDTLVRGHRAGDDQFADLLRRFHLLPEKEQGGFMDLAVMRPIKAIGAAMEFYGSLQETLPKMAVYRMLRERGLVPAAAAAHVRNYAGTPNIFKKGKSANVVRAVVPFYNVFLQGWRSDIDKMNPRSASGWLFKWGATDGLWAVLAALASAGILGAALKELFAGISEYDKTNYNCIPVGWTAGGDYGKKTVYIRLPRSESSRFLSGLTYKMTRLLAGDSPEEWTSLLDFGAGQMPSVNPAVSVPEKWGEYFFGHQPVDSFRGRPIVPDTEWRAGGLYRLKPMLQWTWDQAGGGNFVKWDPRAQTTSELVLSAIPGLNRVLKVSDYGLREEQRAAEREADAARARHRLAMPDNARQLVGEYMFLKGVDQARRTPVQAERYELLNVWYNSFYRPMDESVTLAEQAKQAEAAASLRTALGEVSKGFERPKPK